MAKEGKVDLDKTPPKMKEVIERVLGKSGKPISTYKMVFDSPQDQLGPIYYWILDFINEFGGWKTEKVTDNFVASPGSGQFFDIMNRVTKHQDDAMKMMGAMNQVVKSVLNLIYDMKEFEMRLQHYEDVESKDSRKKMEGLLALKQVWLDNVDIKRGQGSIHALATTGGHVTIREAFMMANSSDDLTKMNSDKDAGLINDVVYRILQPRVKEFFDWINYSRAELTKRMNIEKSYLRSQVETIKLYSTWMRPYLKAAKDLKQQGFDGNAALVNALSTTMFQLTLFSKSEAKLEEHMEEKYEDLYDKNRKYHSCVMVDMIYRGHVSQRATQRGDYGYAMGGRIEMTFYSWALNDDELELVEKEMTKEEMEDTYLLVEDTAAEALNEFKEDLDHFLNDDADARAEEKKKSNADDINPFKVIWDLLTGNLKDLKKNKKKNLEIKTKDDIKKDNFYEAGLRKSAEDFAQTLQYAVYDIYKKAHGMASSPDKFENWSSGGSE